MLTLMVVATGRPGDPASDKAADAMLASFSHPSIDHLVERRVVHLEGRMLQAALEEEIREASPSLVVIGSEHLAAGATSVGAAALGHASHAGALGAGGAATTSLAMALVRLALPVPLLVAKSSSVGEFFSAKWEVGSKAPPPPLRVALEASTSSLSMLTWLMARLDPARDPLLVVRLDGLEKDGTEPMQTTRLLATFANEAAARGFGVSKHAMAEGHVAGLPPLVLQERVDLLAVAAPSSKVTPPHVLELLRSARTNVLVWRPAIKQGVQALGA
uniref:UspA domain-containing protein n=1 Tax=Chlamydomonas euryale TaxID=1486919 RepID=A0A7R9YR11_9CHLO|mmetsp:Transcript_13503/g.39121  ORF Transcript_13503/g.39121 Transcript_13503/m.39121 type:complete len:274 (+) Transcript_13503:464-1285(+)